MSHGTEADRGIRPAETPPIEPASGSVAFRDEGIVTPARDETILGSLGDPRSVAGEELRLLAAKLQDIRRERGASCLAVTSTVPGEGKSTVALGLAGALAREPGRRILLVEADLRRPSLASMLGLPPQPGLAEWLNGSLDTIPVRLVGSGGFFLLVAGQAELERPELVASPRMGALLRAARGAYDFVLLDAMPVLPVADAILIQDLVDGFLLVVRSRWTRRDAIHDALARLRPHGVIGVVLNDHLEARRSSARRPYGGDRGYGPREPQARRLSDG
jgi:Mrp family chromosome partitioning ATPase